MTGDQYFANETPDTAPAATPAPTAHNVSNNEPKNGNLSHIAPSDLTLAENLKQSTIQTNANQKQTDQASEESNLATPEELIITPRGDKMESE
jgi:hypothetical protein